MTMRFAVAVLAVGLSSAVLDGCTEPQWKPSFAPVDSGGGTAIPGLFAELGLSDDAFHQPRMSWSADGSALRIASAGPGAYTQSTLWSVEPVSRSVTTLLALQTSDPFYGVSCYVGTSDCDVSRNSGRVLRRSVNGDTATIIASTWRGHYVSENGRYFAYADIDRKTWLLDASSGSKITLPAPDLAAFQRLVSVSNDGGEVDVIGSGGLSVTRHNTSDGTATTWTVPAESGFSGSIKELQWVGSTLYALVGWISASEIRFIQYQVGGGPAVTLGVVPKGLGTGLWSWRPEAQRMVLERITAQDFNPDILDGPVGVRQFELELIHDGVATRVARSGLGWLNMTLSPDGRTMAYGTYAILLKSLPE